MNKPLNHLRHHVTGAVERGEATPVVEVKPESTVNFVTNGKRKQSKTWSELTNKQRRELDWVQLPATHEYLTYRGQAYFKPDVLLQPIPVNATRFYAPSNRVQWTHMVHDTYDSGVVFRITAYTYIVGRFWCSSNY